MKRNLVSIATLAVAIFALGLTAGCNSSEEIENTLAQKYTEAPREAATSATESTVETTDTEETSTEEDTSEQISEATTDDLTNDKSIEDTKLKPAGIGESVVCDMTSHTYGNATIELTLLDVMRGDAAWEFISNESDLNDPPQKDKEYVLAKFRCKNIKNLSPDSDTITINWGQFHLSDNTFKPKEQLNLIKLNNYLDAKLSEGESCEGYLIYTVDIGQECYTMHDTGAWFSLQ